MTIFAIVFWAFLADHVLKTGELPGAITVLLCAFALTLLPKIRNSWLTFLSFVPLLGWTPGPLHILNIACSPWLTG